MVCNHTVILLLITIAITQQQNIITAKQTRAYDAIPNCSLPLGDRECGERGNKTLYIMAMAPYPVVEGEGHQPSWAGGPEVIPGALLAACHINCNPAILPDYTIELVIADGGCNISSRASSNFVSEQFLYSRNIIGIIGGGCSESSFTVGSLVAQDQISLLQIAPSATSPRFVNELQRYRNTVRLTVSARGYVHAFKKIIKKKGYKEVAILYEATREYMVDVYNYFVEVLKEIEVKANRSFGLFSSYLEQPLKKLEKKVRFIFVFAARKFSEMILCLAYQKNMRSSDYQFVFINRRPEDFLKNVTVEKDRQVLYKCDRSEMDEALSAALLFEFRVTRKDKNTTTISGYTYNQSEHQYNKTVNDHKKLCNINATVNTEFQNAYYDSTWALAMSLHNASLEGVNLDNYTYGQPAATKIIKEQLLQVSFEGLSGKVQFSNETLDGSAVTIINFFQRPSNSTEFRLVGCYDPRNGSIIMEDDILVTNSVFDLTYTLAHPPSALGYVFIALAVLVGLGIIILHFLNGTLRELRTVKATSPQLNHLIFSGCYLILLVEVLYSLDTTIVVEIDSPNRVVYGVLCNAQVWVISLSFSLVFGTVCVKTWRIFRIFSHFRSNTVKYVGDNLLIGFVLCLVLLDVVYLIVWSSINPLVMQVFNEQPEVFRAICACDNLSYWLAFLAGYKVPLLFFVLYLSISTRHVDRPEFKQTKSINTLIYILVIVNTLGFVSYAIITASRTTDLFPIIAGYVTLSVAYILTAIMCAVFLFLPPIYPVLKKKLKISSMC